MRKTTRATSVDHLVTEQLRHFGIDPASSFGLQLAEGAGRLYRCERNVEALWELAQKELMSLDHEDRIALFNAKRFVSFQVAKILDTLRNGFRRAYQHLRPSNGTIAAHGPLMRRCRTCSATGTF